MQVSNNRQLYLVENHQNIHPIHPVHYPWDQVNNPDCKAGKSNVWVRLFIGTALTVASTSLGIAIFGGKVKH